ncbi:YqgQ family protein [Ornithinibacillus bavariensis]|nr:YqgQ family protein [Ornithinibacillus bavariensis]HAM80212.1 DUF910 domain-containing protein [Ornithinibacillus sp.]
MKTFYDVQQILKRFGTFIYTGNRLADIELMRSEINELFKSGMLDPEEYKFSILILRQEENKLNSENR